MFAYVFGTWECSAVEHNPQGSKPDSVSPQSKPVDGLINAQNDSLGFIHHTCQSIGIHYVLVVDEDVLMELDGDARLKQLDRDKLERIKELVVDNLMETWQDCLADAVNAVMGESE